MTSRSESRVSLGWGGLRWVTRLTTSPDRDTVVSCLVVVVVSFPSPLFNRHSWFAWWLPSWFFSFVSWKATRGPSPSKEKHVANHARLLMFRNNLNVSIVLVYYYYSLSFFFRSFFLSTFAGLCSFVRFVPSTNSDPIFRLFFSLFSPTAAPKNSENRRKKKEILFLLDRISWKKKKNSHWPPYKYLSFSIAK